jgi:hypothetical protein
MAKHIRKVVTIHMGKLVQNGFNSSFGVFVSFEGMDSEWITETVANGKK